MGKLYPTCYLLGENFPEVSLELNATHSSRCSCTVTQALGFLDIADNLVSLAECAGRKGVWETSGSGTATWVLTLAPCFIDIQQYTTDRPFEDTCHAWRPDTRKTQPFKSPAPKAAGQRFCEQFKEAAMKWISPKAAGSGQKPQPQQWSASQ
ncbi:uncharacterized [Tachysurus ichikawai]